MHIKNPWLLFFGLSIGPFMVGIDLLAIAVAIEPMTKALSIDIATLQWFLSAYAIGNSSFLVSAGRLADLYGKKIVLTLGLLLFTISSGAIALSSSPLFIIIARLIQGASGGVLPVVGVATVVALHPPEKRTGWISGIIGLSGLGMVLGPAVGGYLIHHFSWRLIFLINVPVGIIGIALIQFFLPKLPHSAATGEKIDWAGVLLFGATLILFTIGVSQGHYWGWASGKTLGIFGATLIVLLAFLYVEKKVKWPLIEFGLFKVKNFISAGLTGFVLYFSLTAWILVYGIYLQRVLGMTAEMAGYSFLPFGIVLAVVSSQMSKISKRFLPKTLIMWGCIVGIVAFLGMAFVPILPSYWLLALFFALFGLAFVFINSNSLPAGLEYMPTTKSGIASGKAFMIRWLGGALGAAIISSLFMSHASKEMYTLAPKNPVFSNQQELLHEVITGQKDATALAATFQGGALNQAQQLVDHSYHHGLLIAMIALAALMLLAFLIALIGIKEKQIH